MRASNVIPLAVSQAKPRISVIMVTYMTGPALLEAVKAVLDDPDIFELILVDNGNTLAARHSLSQLIIPDDKVRLLQGQGNIGFAKACNYGATLASGDYFLFLNPDAVIRPGSALKLVECGRSLSVPWIAGGLLRDINGAEQRGGRRLALTPLSALITFTHLYKLPFFRSLHLENEPVPDGPVPIPVVSGAFLMMDRDSFQLVSGFDEKYFLHVEDIDLCHRVGKIGGEVYFVPDATVMHYGSTSRVPRGKIEWQKFKGFVKYFLGYSDKLWAKGLTILAMPFMMMAIMGRAGWLSFRAAFLGR